MSKTLEQKNTFYLLVWLPVVLLAGSLVFLLVLNMHSQHAQEKLLLLKQQNISAVFTADPSLINQGIKGEYSISVEQAAPLNTPGDTVLYDAVTKQPGDFKMLTLTHTWAGKNYLLTTYVSSKEFFHLKVKVFLTEAFILVLLLAAIVIINRRSSRILWQPFYQTLEKTAAYDVVQHPFFDPAADTGINEFNQLNGELGILVKNVNQAYSNQKQFVENASHEVQTPLAIIRSKLDLLINDPGLTEKNAALLADITEANDRLSQMNKSLLLLARIDNHQFPFVEPIPVSQLLEKILSNYQEHYDGFPTLKKSIQNHVSLNANPALIEILFSNLVKNAVVHNIPSGYIHVTLTEKECLVENSGLPLNGDPQLLFERFQKGAADSKTTGLGLALVKQIAQLYQIGLVYTYADGVHRIKLLFDR